MAIWIARQSLLTYATGVLLLLSTTAHADGEVSKIDVCKDLSQVAKQVMSARQQDVPMSEVLPETIIGLMNWADKYGAALDAVAAEEIASETVMLAYEQPIISVDSYKDQEVTKFENSAFKDCYEAEIE
jgi:hypothetical protein